MMFGVIHLVRTQDFPKTNNISYPLIETRRHCHVGHTYIVGHSTDDPFGKPGIECFPNSCFCVRINQNASSSKF